MKQFTSVHDVDSLEEWIALAKKIKASPFEYKHVGANKTLGLLFLNPSLRTRLSTQKAAYNLGMNVMVMNLNQDSWQIEFEDGTVMNGDKQEHIKEAAQVMSTYCDIVGVRTFAGLQNRAEDYDELVMQKFIRYATVPVISLESASLHPLQSFADLLTIRELSPEPKKVVLTWTPHPKPLPQAVANSFAQWMCAADVDLTIVQPEGFELVTEFTHKAKVIHDQDAALKDADIVYAKNWSAYQTYGQIAPDLDHWMISQQKMDLTNQAKFMHCLPVRRNVVVADDVIDSNQSIVMQQVDNRTYAAQTVLYKMLTSEK